MLLLFAMVAAQSALDAPVIPAQPTIRSEIRRGVDAAVQCDRIDMIEEVQIYERCIDATQSANRQRMGSGFEAFDLGLYHRAREELGILVKVLADNPSPLFDPTLAKSGLAVEEAGYEQSKRALGLSDAEVEGVFHPHP